MVHLFLDVSFSWRIPPYQHRVSKLFLRNSLMIHLLLSYDVPSSWRIHLFERRGNCFAGTLLMAHSLYDSIAMIWSKVLKNSSISSTFESKREVPGNMENRAHLWYNNLFYKHVPFLLILSLGKASTMIIYIFSFYLALIRLTGKRVLIS